MTLWASVDLGTNTFRLLVAEEVSAGRLVFRELHQGVVRLGEGLSAGGRLRPAALARAEKLLRKFRDRLDALGVGACVGALTAAGRDAADGAEFRDLAGSLLGGKIRILFGEEEARLSAKGALSLMPSGSAEVLFLDIGGGSTELAAVHGGRIDRALSVPTGVVKIYEDAAPSDPPAAADLARLTALADEAIGAATRDWEVDAWRGRLAGGEAELVATAGTPLTVAARVAGRDVSDTRALNGVRVSRWALEAVWTDLSSMTKAERSSLPAVERGREDVILAGVALLRAFVHAFHAPAFTASDGGVLEGVLLEAVAEERGDASWLR